MRRIVRNPRHRGAAARAGLAVVLGCLFAAGAALGDEGAQRRGFAYLAALDLEASRVELRGSVFEVDASTRVRAGDGTELELAALRPADLDAEGKVIPGSGDHVYYSVRDGTLLLDELRRVPARLRPWGDPR